MTSDDIIDLIDVMSAAWPWAEWTPSQTDLWCGALEVVEKHDATVAVRKAITTMDKPPSIAWVLGAARNEAERRKETFPALNEPPVDKDGRARLVRLMRDELAKPRPHDHHRGWENCPTCSESVAKYHLTPPPSKLAAPSPAPQGGNPA